MNLRPILVGIICALCFMIIGPFVVIVLSSLLKLPVFSNLFLKAIGGFLILAGISIFIYCTYLFKKVGKGTPAPTDPPREFVAEGIYKHVRNPIYLSYFMIFLGEFFALGHILLLAYLFVAAIFIHFYLVLLEEPTLKSRFGRKYVEYVKKVPRWIPRIKVK